MTAIFFIGVHEVDIGSFVGEHTSFSDSALNHFPSHGAFLGLLERSVSANSLFSAFVMDFLTNWFKARRKDARRDGKNGDGEDVADGDDPLACRGDGGSIPIALASEEQGGSIKRIRDGGKLRIDRALSEVKRSRRKQEEDHAHDAGDA